jgi:hypothetical protein
MDKASADKSYPLKDFNSLDKLSRSLERLKQAKLKLFLKKRISLKSLLKAVWEKHTQVKPEENL